MSIKRKEMRKRILKIFVYSENPQILLNILNINELQTRVVSSTFLRPLIIFNSEEKVETK